MAENLKNGGKGSRGGKRKGAGRPASWLREKCQAIVEKDKLVEFLADVAAGRIMDHKVIDGEVHKVPASLHDRTECAIELLDRGFGKATQMLSNDPENPIGSAVFILPSKEIGEKGGIR